MGVHGGRRGQTQMGPTGPRTSLIMHRFRVSGLVGKVSEGAVPSEVPPMDPGVGWIQMLGTCRRVLGGLPVT